MYFHKVLILFYNALYLCFYGADLVLREGEVFCSWHLYHGSPPVQKYKARRLKYEEWRFEHICIDKWAPCSLCTSPLITFPPSQVSTPRSLVTPHTPPRSPVTPHSPREAPVIPYSPRSPVTPHGPFKHIYIHVHIHICINYIASITLSSFWQFDIPPISQSQVTRAALTSY